MLGTGNYKLGLTKVEFELLEVHVDHHVLHDLVQELLVGLNVPAEVHPQTAVICIDVDGRVCTSDRIYAKRPYTDLFSSTKPYLACFFMLKAVFGFFSQFW